MFGSPSSGKDTEIRVFILNRDNTHIQLRFSVCKNREDEQWPFSRKCMCIYMDAFRVV